MNEWFPYTTLGLSGVLLFHTTILCVRNVYFMMCLRTSTNVLVIYLCCGFFNLFQAWPHPNRVCIVSILGTKCNIFYKPKQSRAWQYTQCEPLSRWFFIYNTQSRSIRCAACDVWITQILTFSVSCLRLPRKHRLVNLNFEHFRNTAMMGFNHWTIAKRVQTKTFLSPFRS